MFNNLTRTLKMGLTAITILIAGGFALAPTAAHANPTYIANCKANPWGGPNDYYFKNRWHKFRNLRTYRYSYHGCTHVLSRKDLSYERVEYCGRGYNYSSTLCSGLHTGLPQAVNDRPNAANWAKKSYAATAPSTIYKRNQLLQGAATSVPAGGGFTLRHWGNLNLGTTTFNHVQLGGDHTDGTGFFTGQFNGVGNYYSYSGVFVITDLGGPITGWSGKASWVGKFQSVGLSVYSDFVLEVDYSARTVDAFVQKSGGYHYLLDATYDTTGFITGSMTYGHYLNNDRRNGYNLYRAGYTTNTGFVRGVIGEEGAVGAFVSHSSGAYSGGFVARRATDVSGAVTHLNRICGYGNGLLTDGDPFHNSCYLEKDKQRKRIVKCGEGGHANNSLCERAATLHPCIKTPFTSACKNNSEFNNVYVGLRTNRRAFCNITSNATNALCTVSSTVAEFCSSNLFGTVCLNSSSYESQRVERARVCAASRYSSGCTSVTTSNICSRVPFGAACTSSSYESQRIARAKTCAANQYASGCTSSYGVTTSKICSRIPFGAACTSSSYESQRVERARVCAANRYTSGCDSSYGVTTSEVCSRVPFGIYCTSSSYESQRIARAKTCAANRYASGCSSSYGVSLSKVCARVPFGAHCTSSSYESQRTAQAKTCAANRYATGCDSSYGVTTSKVCNLVPFGSTCTSSSYETQRITRAKICAANRGDSRCGSDQGVTTSKICTHVPFVTSCTSSSYESYRVTRAKVCAANRSDSSRCGSDQGVTTSSICTRVPFGTACSSSSYESQRIAQAKICAANLSATGCNSSYGVTTSKVCTLVPFGTACTSSSYESDRVTRAKICAANLSDSRCTTGQNITASKVCTLVPFGTACSSDTYESDRIAQAKICAADRGATGCTSSYHVSTADICTRVPFLGVCVDDGNFDDERTSRLEFCDIASNSNHPNCTDTNLSNICSYAPFSPFCLKHTGSITKRTDIAFNACRPSDSDDPKCYGVRKMPSGGLKPDAATWVDGFVTKTNPNGLSSVVDINRGSQFVEASKTNLDQTGIHLVHRSATLLRELDTTDGVGFLWGETRTGSQIFVAGILADTDLGAPLTEAAKTSVVWRGEFQSLRYDTKTDFDLTINFGPSGTGSIEAFIERKIGEYDFVNTPHYYLDGRFDANGLITGRVIAGRFVNETPTTGTDYAYQGVLRGIIGEDGAVGAFVGGKSRDEGITFHTAGHFAGGFVAAPAEVVEYADWVDIANPDTTRTSPLTNQFLAGSDGTVASGIPVTITFANASYEGRSFNGDGKDGVQLFTNPTNGAVTNVYAGILTTTNLGAPLDATTAAAVWEGRLFASLVTGAPAYEVADFRPYIDFNESSMDATITGVTQSDGTALARSVVYSFYAEFDTRGVIDGTITRSSKGRASTGELTGLIGAEGAVGAFISDPNARVSYAGGFVARPTQ